MSIKLFLIDLIYKWQKNMPWSYLCQWDRRPILTHTGCVARLFQHLLYQERVMFGWDRHGAELQEMCIVRGVEGEYRFALG